MATRTVRLDPEAEATLASLTRSTGLSISEVLKEGLFAFRERLQSAQPDRTAYAIFKRLELGPGGYARTPARRAKEHVRELIARKHRR